MVLRRRVVPVLLLAAGFTLQLAAQMTKPAQPPVTGCRVTESIPTFILGDNRSLRFQRLLCGRVSWIVVRDPAKENTTVWAYRLGASGPSQAKLIVADKAEAIFVQETVVGERDSFSKFAVFVPDPSRSTLTKAKLPDYAQAATTVLRNGEQCCSVGAPGFRGDVVLERGVIVVADAIFKPGDPYSMPSGGNIYFRLRLSGNALTIDKVWRTAENE